MTSDLSLQHQPVSSLFPQPVSKDDWEKYRLTNEQVEFFHDQGYLAGIKLFDDQQIESLRAELTEFFSTEHEGKELWHEYHTNESGDPNNVLFHALGAWRLRPAFHDILWNPAFLVPASQLLGALFGFGMISCFASQPGTAAMLLGIKTILIGREPSRWRI